MTDTEKKIKDATIELLLKEGRFGVSMQEIAEKSKISRTVIHYYFRSKERLFALVNQEIVEKLVIPRYHKLFDNEHLKIKIENFLTASESSLTNYPYVDIYVMTEFAENEYIRNYFDSVKPSLELLLNQITRAITEKKICHSDPIRFLMDLLALSSYSHICLNFVETNNILPGVRKENLFMERNETILKILLLQYL
ncbi:hypothetical protein GCM10022217_25510 [Chryseobacterium ginsenosidimutans]|uniref:TetR/AcrR family transcriptional regulator n=1 Tax=Chryseobacterium ginsenosidimutans TaxID=687846 RepID=UPI0031D33E3F